MSPQDALALSMVAMLAVAFSILLMILIYLVKNAGKEDELAELMKEDNKPSPFSKQKQTDRNSTKAWEKEADWWKDQT